jgi:hypothetical protein
LVTAGVLVAFAAEPGIDLSTIIGKGILPSYRPWLRTSASAS